MPDPSAPARQDPAAFSATAASAEQRLGALIALSTEAIISTDSQQRITLFNRGAEEMFGYSAAEALGQPLAMLLPSAMSASHHDIVAALLREGNVSRRMGERRPVRGRRRTGEEFEAIISISTIRFESGVIATAIIRDVSELRIAEEALRSSEARYRTLVDASPAAIFTVSLDGRVLDANPAFARMYGLPSPDQARGIALSALFLDPDDWPRIVTVLADHSQYAAAEHRLRSVGGDAQLSVLIKAVRMPATPEGEDCAHLFALDVTALRLLEETVRRTEHLDFIGRLAAGVAHDFNNLLLVIRISASMLAEESGLSEQGRCDLAEIEQAAVRAGELTQQLLAFGRRQVLRPVALDLGALVQRIADLLRRLLGEDVMLRLDVGSASARVSADEAQVERVLANLATNARDAMPSGGMVEIRVEARTPTEEDRGHCPDLGTGDWVHLSFSDSGAGIDAATRARIFDPFFSTKEIGLGAGLGLASVHGIMTQSGGRIGVESAVGRGTTFHLWFPGSGTPAAEMVLETDAARAHESHFVLPVTVLLVEDEPTVRATVERVLVARGITVLSAYDATSALVRLASHEGPVDAVISDIVLPGLSGQRVVDWIAERYPDIRVLFMSGYSPEAADHRGVMQAGSAFLSKPFAPDDLLSALATLLDRA